MCGIVGIASSSRAPNPELVARMRDTLRHRGPDDEGLWCSADGTTVFGHRRLAVIDLSPGGHQPMADTAGECHIVFNGEIYNYQELRQELCRDGRRFGSASDTEVILEAYRKWGPDCVGRLNGMFAFAIYDAAKRELFIARDRAGEKPVYYRHGGGALAFASELKALLADPQCPRDLDTASLDAYFAYGYVPYEQCILRGIRKLPQAHALRYDVTADSLSTWAYWSLPEPEAPGRPVGDDELVERLERTLSDSVRLRLIADVPVGVMLSGGIDSSLVTAMAARLSPRVRTFTISFPGHGSFDEARHAALVAAHFGTDHVVLPAEPATVDLLPALAHQYDEPFADSSMVPTYLVSRLIRREATVALGGDGGDELFGGYPHHSWVQSHARWSALVPSSLARTARPLASQLLPMGMRGRNYLLGMLATPVEAIAQFNQFFDPAARRRLLAPVGNGAGTGAPERQKALLAASAATPLRRATITDFRSYMVDDILVKVDRASMLNSLEVRAPWLDPRLIEFAFRDVPDRLRATATERKILPRRLAARLLPRGVDLDRKQGFSLPLYAWFKGEWGAFMREIIEDADPAIFDREMIRTIIRAQERGYSNTQRLFALTMFELWRREYRIA